MHPSQNHRLRAGNTGVELTRNTLSSRGTLDSHHRKTKRCVNLIFRNCPHFMSTAISIVSSAAHGNFAHRTQTRATAFGPTHTCNIASGFHATSAQRHAPPPLKTPSVRKKKRETSCTSSRPSGNQRKAGHEAARDNAHGGSKNKCKQCTWRCPELAP